MSRASLRATRTRPAVSLASVWSGVIRGGLIAACLIGALVSLRPLWRASDADGELRRAASHLMRDQFADAERCAQRVLDRRPHSSLALLIAGEAAIRLKRDEDAINYFLRVKDDASADAVHALYRAGDRFMALGHARRAEQYLRRALAHDPAHPKANGKLAVLLQIEGRTWESVPYLRRLLLNGHLSKTYLQMIGSVENTFVEDYQFIENCLVAEPDDPLVLLGRARQALIQSRLEDAKQLLKRILADQPELIEAQARLGKILFDKGIDSEFLEWQRNLPPTADEHPEIWYVRGLWARRDGQRAAAVRCFLEAASLDPNHQGAVMQLSQLLSDTRYADLTEQLAERSQQLAQLHYLVMEMRGNYDGRLVRKMVDILDALGRPIEAVGWCQMLEFWETGDEQWGRSRALELAARIPTQDELTLPSGQLVAKLDRQAFPLPVWPTDVSEARDHRPLAAIDGEVRFTNSAPAAGIEFDYFNGTAETVGLVHILQATGGGVAVIDYDQDSWPDVYFVQSGPYPIQPNQTQYVNRLYRNLGNGRFEDVTQQSGLGDAGYGQGVAVGDYNSDGFPDLYVANFGANRLFENTGDGRFVDVTDRAGVGGDVWTTSCMMADLDGDALPEIYATNYALKDEVLNLDCKHKGRPRTCAPTLLTAEQDNLYRNLGDGRFDDVTEQCGVVAVDGKGLGVVAADFELNGRLNIFVGNDTAANFYFRNNTEGPGQPLMFSEEAIINGLGFDEVGSPQACMGVAAGDANGDGLIDLFVTNYYGESNVLYLQSPEHWFTDLTRQANLRECGYHMLGFGTQFVDGELDGWPDLIISNGHVDLTFAHGNPDRMPPQYCRNLGDGRFVELTAESLGPYFQQVYFGRSLATLDWNRDGREDVCISHLDALAALLTNVTESTGNFLAVRLRGTRSNRDAIGAVVTVEANGRRWVRQIMGGNGYQVSNQRQLIFGLAEAPAVDRLAIRWPAGGVQEYEQLEPNQELLVIEGGDLVSLSKGGESRTAALAAASSDLP